MQTIKPTPQVGVTAAPAAQPCGRPPRVLNSAIARRVMISSSRNGSSSTTRTRRWRPSASGMGRFLAVGARPLGGAGDGGVQGERGDGLPAHAVEGLEVAGACDVG